MFLKKYKVKTSTTLKGSERKKLRCLVESQYPSLSPEDLNLILSSKNELSQAKVLVHSNAVVMIYYSGNNPMFFLIENRIFPTVYTLWKFPLLVPSLPTVPVVLEKICNGADLMAPGIIINDVTVNEFHNLKPNDICSVRLEGNKAPVAVGTAVLSDDEILTEGRKGKAMLIMHCYRDNLWSSGDQSLLPLIAETILDSVNANIDNQDEFNVQGVSLTENDDMTCVESRLSEVELNAVENSEPVPETEMIEKETAVEYSMDEILKQCFMLTLKVNCKKIPLPVLTSTFYRTYVLNCCPPELSLDIKKTTYKKLSVFLKSMSSHGLIDVKELTKGVESIVAINLEHEEVKSFIPGALFKEYLKRQKEENVVEEPHIQDNYKFPEIVEMFIISAQVKMLFESVKHKKGEALTANKVRDALREYVKMNSLQVEDNPRMVVLDPILSNCLLKSNDSRDRMAWEELHEIVISRMSPAFMIKFEGEEAKLRKGHIDPIDVSIATRSGNKKVTLINNLENFGIKPEKLANHVQVAVAASTSVSLAPNGKGMQVLIQGNQLRYLQTLFSDIYKVPKKYLRGLENVSTKKKK